MLISQGSLYRWMSSSIYKLTVELIKEHISPDLPKKSEYPNSCSILH